MLRLVLMLITGILVSFYYFPFEFVFMPEVNTKMAMAAAGLVLAAIRVARRRMPVIDKDFLTISVLAGIVSLICLAAVVWNGTEDYTYVTYIVSMWVWLSAAYVAVSVIRAVHGTVSVTLVCNYLIAVCVFQCLIAIAIDMIPALKMAVDRVVVGMGFTPDGWMETTDRLYGIGATLDVAGSRFSVVLIMIVHLCLKRGYRIGKMLLTWYISAFFVIAVIGNMIARTTTVGLVLALAYLAFSALTIRIDREHRDWTWTYLGGLVATCLLSVVVLYNTSPVMKSNIRFAFEGFFSLAEEGRWEVHSNEILQNMVVFPDNAKTWLIGDGYIENPYGKDPYYMGPQWHGYYMQTDIGYLRFIFYFGIFGLLAFIYFIWRAGKICIGRFPSHTVLFLLMLAVNYIVWMKVSTDIFLVFALFLCVGQEENDDYDRLIAEGR